jgi:hypothetical protein
MKTLEKVHCHHMSWALSLFAAGMGVIGLISFRRRPQPFVALCFITFVLMVFGVLGLGITGAGLEYLFRSLIRWLGLFPTSSESVWRIAMLLSLMSPLGLIVSYWISRSRMILILVFIAYCFLCDVLAHLLVRAI